MNRSPSRKQISRKQSARINSAAHFIAILRQHQPDLATRYHVRSLGVFGSYLQGKQKKNSDLDVLVELGDDISLIKFIEMENYLSDLLGVRVDLVEKQSLKPSIGQRVLQQVVQI